MASTDHRSKWVARSWVRRLRLAATLITLIGAIPGAFASFVLLAHFFWADPASVTAHAFPNGKCRDVR